MFGLTFEKLFIIAIIAAVLIGPDRLPGVTRTIAQALRGIREYVDTARARAERETGMTEEDWRALDPRRYDPRRIVREALAESPSADPDAEPAADPVPAGERPAPRYVIGGTSGHPVRIRVDEPAPAEGQSA